VSAPELGIVEALRAARLRLCSNCADHQDRPNIVGQARRGQYREGEWWHDIGEAQSVCTAPNASAALAVWDEALALRAQPAPEPIMPEVEVPDSVLRTHEFFGKLLHGDYCFFQAHWSDNYCGLTRNLHAPTQAPGAAPEKQR
jgi:hypothetical protein